ncbi:hypothetical protein AXG93_2268s1000 [Marchantia polymorpha subsp. ruderalis]|uniref:Uncharacterized protein n=1 Tax=Marchantia polymorpha subsp. ruderalis TaxID=1480154 RepID=A0A176VCZ6_MARPO|nr:hypothetical protein AXG93_2268s1000 [Marchantia polymorpha subsp. ruderalis]
MARVFPRLKYQKFRGDGRKDVNKWLSEFNITATVNQKDEDTKLRLFQGLLKKERAYRTGWSFKSGKLNSRRYNGQAGHNPDECPHVTLKRIQFVDKEGAVFFAEAGYEQEELDLTPVSQVNLAYGRVQL